MSLYFDRIGNADQAMYHPGASFGFRRMRDFEFVWINQGDVVWHCNGEDHDCPERTLLLVRPGMLDAFTWDPVKQTRHSFVHFSIGPLFTEQFPQHAEQRSWPKVLRLPEANVAFPLFDHLRYVQSQPEVCEELEQHCLLQILLAFLNRQCDLMGDVVGTLHPAIQRVFAYLEEFWADDSVPMPNVKALVRAAGVSEVHLGRLFQEAFGMSPAKAIRTMRMERAAKYLVRTDLQIQEISDILECDNPYHFSRSFKSVFKRSPRTYRRFAREHPYQMRVHENLPWSGNLLLPSKPVQA